MATAPQLSAPQLPSATVRLASIDAYRGLVMLLMMAEVLQFKKVSDALPDNGFWRFLAQQQTHVAWTGCVLHDLIQPSFSFLVGVALPFSLASRLAKGQSRLKITAHAFWRALVLVLLGVFLRSLHSSQTNWTFEDTLTQIGLGYGFLFLLAFCPRPAQGVAFVVILFGYWLWFALYPLPAPQFDWPLALFGTPTPTRLPGFAAHWNLNTNPAWAFDTWFLNLFPREKPFVENGGGYSTLSFIPTLATMILGLLAGGVLKTEKSARDRIVWFLIAGVIGLFAGWLLDAIGVCPIVKRIWTPAWVLFSGGWCFLILAGFYAVMDVWNRGAWAFVLVVIGMNSIAAYLIAESLKPFIYTALPRHLGTGVFEIAGPAYEPLLHGAAVLTVEWLLLFWMYRRKIFLRV